MDVLKLLALNHIIAAVAGSMLSLGITLFFLRIFSVKRPSVQHAFLLIPLIKPFFTLIGGVQFTEVDKLKWKNVGITLHGSMRLPDPLNLVPTSLDSIYRPPNVGYMKPPATTDLFAMVATIVIVAVSLLLITHWITLLRYRVKLTRKKEADREEYKEALYVMNGLSKKFNVKTPKLIFSETPCPFTIGIINTAIILPNGAVEDLTEDELEVVLAHEIAHVKRKDNLWLWISIVCRDIMFFNPIAWLTFRLLSAERERSADYLAVKITQRPIELASSLIKIAERMSAYTGPSIYIAKTGLLLKSNLNKRVDSLLEFKYHKRLALRIVPISFLFIFLFFVRFNLVVKLSKDTLLLFPG